MKTDAQHSASLALDSVDESSTGRRRLLRSMVSTASRCLGLRQQPKSILRNQTNLPMFLAMAVGLSLLCNFTLRENTAEASRAMGRHASVEQLLEMLRKSPDDYELHSRIADVYFHQKNYRRAMFHLGESTRLIERYGE